MFVGRCSRGTPATPLTCFPFDRHQSMTLIPYAYANAVVDEFHALLSTHKINPPARSKAENDLFSMAELLEIWRDPQGRIAQPCLIRAAAGAHDLASKVLCARGLPEFPAVLPHLKLMAEAPDFSRVILMDKGDGRDDLSRKYAELYLACLAIHCGTGLRLDHPVKSKGDNPDVMLLFEGKTWALAVKTISSTQGQSVYTNIAGAAEQIERSSAAAGLVVINAKNVIPHDTIWNKNYGNLDEAVADLNAVAREICTNASANRPDKEWQDVFQSKATVAPVLFILQSVARIHLSPGLVSTPIKVIACDPFGRSLDDDAMKLAESLNMVAASLLGSTPPAHLRPTGSG